MSWTQAHTIIDEVAEPHYTARDLGAGEIYRQQPRAYRNAHASPDTMAAIVRRVAKARGYETVPV